MRHFTRTPFYSGADDPEIGQKFYNNFMGQYDFQAMRCDEKCRKFTYCNMQADVFNENFDCEDSPTPGQRAMHFLELLAGNKWEYSN